MGGRALENRPRQDCPGPGTFPRSAGACVVVFAPIPPALSRILAEDFFNAKTQRREGAEALEAYTVGLGFHRWVSASGWAAAVEISRCPPCVLASLRLGVEFRLNRYG
jgi:hypothetical protein